MAHRLMVVPVSDNVDLHDAALNLIQEGSKKGLHMSHFQPVIFKQLDNQTPVTSVSIEQVEKFLIAGRKAEFLEKLVSFYETISVNQDVVVIEGLPYCKEPYLANLNVDIATAFDAYLIFIGDHKEENQPKLTDQIKMTKLCYPHAPNTKILGSYVNKTIKKLDGDTSFSASSNLKANVFDNLTEWMQMDKYYRLTPPFFRHHLIKKAREAEKCIVLPEGNEVRTLQAAAICAERNIAKCILLGEKDEIQEIAKDHSINLSDSIRIMDPKPMIEQYISPMVELRKHKGMTSDIAREQLQDNVVLGTMMLKLGEADGLVSGATHSTANTIRPAFQLIKTLLDTKIVSSVFFVCMPQQVLVFGDCAVNPNPTSHELADIAIQSADSAAAFGISPRVAMISYSTGYSGHGTEVDKVREALQIAKEKRSDLLIDGPLQYDAALIPAVAKQKASDSPVAGCATVLIFPDLNTGNAVYKAVQRTANILCIGPMIQGLKQPVNDLSRGCLVEDIVFTIALTAVQAIK